MSEISASGEPFGLFAMVRCLVELVELVLRLMACPRDASVFGESTVKSSIPTERQARWP